MSSATILKCTLHGDLIAPVGIGCELCDAIAGIRSGQIYGDDVVAVIRAIDAGEIEASEGLMDPLDHEAVEWLAKKVTS